MEPLKTLLDSRNKLVHDARQILNTADADKRDLTSEERQEYDRIDVDIEKLNSKIEIRRGDEQRRSRLASFEAASEQSAGRQTAPSTLGALPGRVAGNDGAAEAVFKLKGKGRRLTIQPGTPEWSRCQPEYHKSFLQYVGTGQTLGLQVAKDTKGGYLAPVALVAQLIKFLDDLVFMRELSTVLPPMESTVNLGVPSLDTDPNDADWTAEIPAADIAEDDNMALGKREFMPHLLTKLIKMSTKLIRTSILDVEALIAWRLAYKFAITEEKAFLLGTGNQQPLGVYVADANGVSTSRDVACASTSVFTADEFIDCLYNLKAIYQGRSTWLVHRDTVKRVRKLKDGVGQYLWMPGMAGDRMDTILGRPYKISEYAPNTYTTGKYVAIVGDFKTGYWIGDSLNLEIQRLNELFALRNQVGLLGRKETDGMPVLEECFSRLKLA